jgi:hypothetical protein
MSSALSLLILSDRIIEEMGHLFRQIFLNAYFHLLRGTSLISRLQVLILTCTHCSVSMGFLFSSQLKTAVSTAWMIHYLLQHLSPAEQQDIDPVHLTRNPCPLSPASLVPFHLTPPPSPPTVVHQTTTTMVRDSPATSQHASASPSAS